MRSTSTEGRGHTEEVRGRTSYESTFVIRSSMASKKPKLIGHATKDFTLLAAAPSTGVTVTRSTKGGAIASAKLNTKKLVFSGDEAHAVVGQGQTNTLEWVAVGPPGSSFTIKVTEPKKADCGGGSTLDASGKDAGSCDFDT